MEFGIFARFAAREGQSQADAYDEWLDLAMLSEEVGIDCFWLAEFHFRPHQIVSAPLVVASAIAARTERMRIGIAVQLLPLVNPVLLAEQTATVDHMSKGRLVLGVGRSSFLDAYQGYNVSYAESRPRFFECLEILQKGWGDEPFDWKGEFYDFHNVNVIPKPFQRPAPPIRIACESRESFEMMGKLGFPVLIRHQMPIAELKGLLDAYQAARLEAGFTGPLSSTLQLPVYVADSAEQARADTEGGMKRERLALAAGAKSTGDLEAPDRIIRAVPPEMYDQQLQRPGLGAFPNPYLFGPPDFVADCLLEYQDALGITGVSMAMDPGGIPPEKIERSVRLFAEKVMPKVNTG